MFKRLGILVCAAWFAASTPARAQDTVLGEALGLTGTVMWLNGNSGAPGLVLAAISGPNSSVRGYGETTKGNGQAPDGTSLFRLASISKVFTTELLAGMAVDGKVRITDALQQYANGRHVPRFGERSITLLDLATHSAALPREIGDKPDSAAPFAWPTRDVRWDWLATYQLGWAPGSASTYSNVSFDLLADALTTAEEKSYAALLHDRITGPLGMADTGVTPTSDQCARLMTGSGIGGPGPCVDTSANGGSGGIYSTGNDMLRWLRHQMDEQNPATWRTLALQHAVYRKRSAMTTAIGFDGSGMMDGLALGWIVVAAHEHVPMIIQKTGGGGGFMTYIAFVPGRDAGIFLAVNRTDFMMFHDLTVTADALLAVLAPR